MKMCTFHPPYYFQDAGCVYASMEWTPLQTGGGVCALVLGDGRLGLCIGLGTPMPDFRDCKF